MAPTFVHGKSCVFNMTSATGGVIVFSSGMDDSELSRVVETADVTNYGSLDHEYIIGLKDKTFTVSGHLSSTHVSKLASMWGHSTGSTIHYSPLTTAAGNPDISGKGFMTEYTISSPVADKVSVSLSFQGSGAWTSTTHA